MADDNDVEEFWEEGESGGDDGESGGDDESGCADGFGKLI
jgi:hypothetical protein